MPSKTFTIKNFKISSLNGFLKALIDDETILELKDSDGDDVYLLASYYGHLEIMKYLEKEHNWNIQVKDNDGDDVYLLASRLSNLEIMKYLEKEHNWNIHVKNKYGDNAYELGNNKIKRHLRVLYKKEKEKEKVSNLENELKKKNDKISNLENKLKQIKEAFIKITFI